MSNETTTGPARPWAVPMTAERRAEIREILTGAGPSIPMGPNALFALREDRDANRRAAVDLLAEIDRLGALWAAVAKDSRNHKAEADGRREYGEELKAENERLREELIEKAAEVDDKSDVGHAVAEAWMEDARRYAGNADYWRERTSTAEATLDRVRALHTRCEGHTRDCDDCLGHNNVCSWCGDQYPCATIAAIDQGDLPAVRAFAAEHDPRGEAK